MNLILNKKNGLIFGTFWNLLDIIEIVFKCLVVDFIL